MSRGTTQEAPAGRRWMLNRLPRTDDELYELVRVLWGVTIPRTQVCHGHSTPFAAFAEAYFARSPVSIWKASRGLGGKSRTLAYLALTEAALLGAQVNVLGGSGAQSINVHEAMAEGWNHDLSPRWLIDGETNYETRLTNGAKVRALLASTRAVRGPHPQRLRMDEIDEMDQFILDSALGQPMNDERRGIDAQTVLSSTHHYPDATMTAMIKRAGEQGFPVHEWCWRESNNKTDGWLTDRQVARTRATVTKRMWEVEYDLQEPSFAGRAIDAQAVESTFDPALGVYDRSTNGRELWLPTGPHKPFVEPDRHGEYVHGVDWAKEQDWTVIQTWRVDGPVWKLVAYGRFQRQPWPVMVKSVNDTVNAYGGYLVHDQTGIGGVVNDLLEYPKRLIKGEIMSGRHRQDMLTEAINGVEKGLVLAPMVVSAHSEWKYMTSGDVYEPGKTGNHLPDTFASFALAWTRRPRVEKVVAAMPVGERDISPWRSV